MSDEKRYTLEEAQLELRREECDVLGHDYEIVVRKINVPYRLVCSRCGRFWRVVEE